MFNELTSQLEFTFQIPEGKLGDFANLDQISQSEPLVVRSIYPNRKAKHGLHYVAICTDAAENILRVNLPKFSNDVAEKIRSSEEMVNAVNAGKCGLKASGKRTSSAGNDYHMPIFCDL